MSDIAVGIVGSSPYSSATRHPVKVAFERLRSQINENKKKINTAFCIAASITNLFVFLNNNINFFNVDSESSEKVGNFFARLGVVVRGITGGLDSFNKNNLLPFLGFMGEIISGLFIGGDNLWLARGIAQGTHQSQGIIKRRGIKVTKDGKEITLGKNDGDNFKKYKIKRGEGLWLTIKELGKIIKELFTNPFNKEQLFSHSVFTCSLGMIVGPLIYLSGLKKLGAGIRDFGGAAVDWGYMIDKREKDEPSFIPCGTVWNGSALVDFIKRFDFFTSKLKSLTQLSLFFDGIAAAYYANANFGKKEAV